MSAGRLASTEAADEALLAKIHEKAASGVDILAAYPPELAQKHMNKALLGLQWQQPEMASGWQGYSPGLNASQPVQGSQVYTSAQLGAR